MKSTEQINNRIDSLYDSLSKLGDLLNTAEDIDEELEIESDMAIIEAKINSLRWVLD